MTITSTPGIDLLTQTYVPGTNALISPASIQIALAMLARGASGETKEQLDRVVAGADRFQAPADEVLRVANSLWSKGSIKAQYTQELLTAFGAEAHALGDPAGAVKRINAWTSEATDGLIDELLNEGDIDELTVLALVNAITFKGTWIETFDIEATREATFKAPGGDKAVMMMRKAGVMPYERTEHAQATRLDYVGDYSLHAILPDEGCDPLQALRVHSGDYRTARAELHLPRFDMRCRTNLKAALKQIGCGRMFEARGELDGISSDPQLEVSKVVHEACMMTDEQGTTAAAATAILVRMRGRAPLMPVMRFDRPFAFKLTRGDDVLFAGVCCDPGNPQ
jgi:serpin B